MSIKRTAAAIVAITLVMGGCSSPGPAVPSGTTAGETAQPPPTMDAATRGTPVVAGRPARVFIFAGVGKSCEPVAEPEITIAALPSQGDVSVRTGQETTIMSSAQGTCVGAKARGTGVYYTARAGAQGTDRFTVTAKLASGESSTRTFEVRIAE